MAERKRNKEIHFYVTEEERKLIRRKMIESKTKNMGAYLRKMAIDGYIVNTDTTPLKKQYERHPERKIERAKQALYNAYVESERSLDEIIDLIRNVDEWI